MLYALSHSKHFLPLSSSPFLLLLPGEVNYGSKRFSVELTMPTFTGNGILFSFSNILLYPEGLGLNSQNGPAFDSLRFWGQRNHTPCPFYKS